VKLAVNDDNAYLGALESDWQQLMRYRDRRAAAYTRTYCTFETVTTHGVYVVGESESSTRCDEREPFPLDHIQSSKPRDRDDPLYVWVRSRVVGNGPRPATDTTVVGDAGGPAWAKPVPRPAAGSTHLLLLSRPKGQTLAVCVNGVYRKLLAEDDTIAVSEGGQVIAVFTPASGTPSCAVAPGCRARVDTVQVLSTTRREIALGRRNSLCVARASE